MLGADVAELLASLTLLVGAERAVERAAANLPADVLGRAVPLIQKAVLSAPTRRRYKDDEKLLDSLRDRAASAAGIDNGHTGAGPQDHRRWRRVARRLAGPRRLRVQPRGQLGPDLGRVHLRRSRLRDSGHRDDDLDVLLGRDESDRLGDDRSGLRPHGRGDVRAVVPQPLHAGQRRRDGDARALPAAERPRHGGVCIGDRDDVRRERRRPGGHDRRVPDLGRVERQAERLRLPRHRHDRDRDPSYSGWSCRCS